MLDPQGSALSHRHTVIAIYHASVKSFSRGKGESSTAAAAYRAGLKIEDERTGLVHDYTRRAGVESVDILAPKDAPAWASDPKQFWSKCEAAETRANARVARELEVALPAELTAKQRHALAVDLGQLCVDRYGVVAQVAVHAPDKGGDERNHHAHILLSPRVVGPEGLGSRAMADFDARQGAGADAVRELRAAVAERINFHLESAARPERVDHRSLDAQAQSAELAGDHAKALTLTRVPTQHEGKTVTAAKRKGRVLDRALENQQRTQSNRDALAGHLRAARQESRKTLPAAPRRSAAPQPMAARPAPLPASRAQVGGGRITSAGKTTAAKAEALMANDAIQLAEQQARKFLDMLDELSKQNARHYAKLHNFTMAQTGELAQAMARKTDPTTRLLVADCIDKHKALEYAKARPERRQKAMQEALRQHGDAERAEVAFLRDHPQPGVFNPKSRADWAKRRDAHKKRSEQSRVELERAKERAESYGAQDCYRDQTAAAEAAYAQAEVKRRAKPLPFEQEARDRAAYAEERRLIKDLDAQRTQPVPGRVQRPAVTNLPPEHGSGPVSVVYSKPPKL